MNKLRAIKSVSLLTFSSILSAACAFLTHVLLARELGPESFGVFSSTLALVVLFVPLAGFGVSSYWLKAFGEEGPSAIRWLYPTTILVSLTTLLSLLFLVVWAMLGGHNDLERGVLILLSLYLLGQVSIEFVVAKYQLEGKYLHVSCWQLIPNVLRLLGVLVLIFILPNFFHLDYIAFIYALVSFSILALSLVIIRRILTYGINLDGHSGVELKYSLNNGLSSLKELVAATWPFSLAGVFYLVYFQSDIILLKYLDGNDSAGIYNTAIVIMSALYLFPTVLYQKYLQPKLHLWANYDSAKFRAVYLYGNKLMLVVSVFFAIALIIFSKWFFILVFGYEYSKAILVLYVFSIAVPFRFLAASVGSVLVTINFMVTKVKLMGITAVLNVALNCLLIPRFGIIGAAIATVISDICLVSLYYIFAEKLVFKKTYYG